MIKVLTYILCTVMFAQTMFTDASVKIVAEESSVIYEEKEIITGFEELAEAEQVYYFSKAEKPDLEKLLELFPKTLEVYVGASVEKTSMEVTWYSVGEDYEESDAYYFQFSPSWDQTQYPVSEGFDIWREAPYIAVFLSDEDVSSSSVTGKANETIIFEFLHNEMGLNVAAACGVLANIYHESSFNPNAAGDKGTSYGICQWHGVRWDAMKSWCEKNGHDWTTLEGQLHYLKFELSQNNGNYLWNGRTIYNYISKVPNTAEGAYEAGRYWCFYYEVPANRESVSVTRGNLAQNVYWAEYGNTAFYPEGQITDTGRTLSLADVIFINQYITVEGFEEIDVTKDGGLLIWKNEVTEENALFGTEDILKEGLKASGTEYVQQSHGIAAKEYGDTLYLRIYLKTGEDTYVYSPLKEYSVRAYCDKVFKNPEKAGEKLVKTCAAMLHYGAAAQKYFDYKVDNLANEDMDYPAVEWNPELINAVAPFTTNIESSDKVTDTGRTLSLDGAIVVNCYYKFAGTAKAAELLVWDGVEAELTAENVSYTVDMKNVGEEFLGNPQAFAAKEYDKTIYVCARFVNEDDSVHYSNVVAYHPEQYAANVLEKAAAGVPSALKAEETVKNMVTYGQFAGEYFGTK